MEQLDSLLVLGGFLRFKMLKDSIDDTTTLHFKDCSPYFPPVLTQLFQTPGWCGPNP